MMCALGQKQQDGFGLHKLFLFFVSFVCTRFGDQHFLTGLSACLLAILVVKAFIRIRDQTTLQLLLRTIVGSCVAVLLILHPNLWQFTYHLQVLWMFDVVWDCTTAVVESWSIPEPPCGVWAANGILTM